MKLGLRRGLQGPQMLAFLPALCLAAYWGGGEILLVLCALLTPLAYALTGGFGRMADADVSGGHQQPDPVEVAQQFLETAQHTGQTTACFQVEISDLSEIARTLDDAAADDARQQLIARFKSSLRDTDHVFPTGDARFTVLISPGYRLKLDSLLDVAKRMRASVEDPLSLGGTARHLSAAIGVASSLNFGRNATGENWLASATQALNEACLSGPSATRVWSDKLSRQCQTRTVMREDLAIAFEKGQIQAYFQPQVSVRTGLVSGMEALARWDHPVHGILAPASFLQALKDSGCMDRLGKVILSQALQNLFQWDKANLDVPSVSVNFSEIELRNPNLPEHISSELRKFGLTPQRLVIEVLETTVSNETDDILRRNLHSLADMGCAIDLDDYGTGHASITTLRQFPIDRLKIDQAFLRDADTKADKKQLLCAIQSMADHLNIATLAEGVETHGEHGVLQDLEIPYAQGFLYAEPQSPTDIAAWLQHHHAGQEQGKDGNIRLIM
ncbi:GGDEF domain-containing phosphodiesterase [Marivita sp. S6314]|nr:GGDEF domain-containing phosphodiesterase [Marivita sp. S6314]